MSAGLRDIMKSVRVDAVGLGLGSSIGADELLPSLVTLVDDLDGVLLGLGLSGEGKDVLLDQPLLQKMKELVALTSGFPSGIL
jgi:hypothetical protein